MNDSQSLLNECVHAMFEIRINFAYGLNRSKWILSKVRVGKQRRPKIKKKKNDLLQYKKGNLSSLSRPLCRKDFIPKNENIFFFIEMCMNESNPKQTIQFTKRFVCILRILTIKICLRSIFMHIWSHSFSRFVTRSLQAARIHINIKLIVSTSMCEICIWFGDNEWRAYDRKVALRGHNKEFQCFHPNM